MSVATLSQSRPRPTTRFLGPGAVAQWAKVTGRAFLDWSHVDSHGTGINFPNDFWGQVDVWIPPNTFTACGEDGNHDLFGDTANFIDFGNDSLLATDIGGGVWRWLSDYSNTAASGPAPSTTYTIQFHYVYTSGPFATVTWYVNGVLVITDTGVSHGNQHQIFLSHFAEGCCCEIYYYTNVKIGTSSGGTDIFQDDFSGGLGNWILTENFQPAAITLVSAPSAAACPTITVSPTRGLPGQPITLTGTGFAPDSPLTLFLDNNNWIEPFSATTDGSGNVSVTFPIPNVPETGTGDPYFVNLIDDQGNIACDATLSVCGAISADGISTDVADPILALAGSTDGMSSPLILDYIFHDGAHWVLWQDVSSITNNSTFPPPTNHTANVTRVSADGSSVTDYPIDTNYEWGFDSTDTAFVSGGVWIRKFWFTSWAKSIYDAKLASDGTTLWVALLTRETVQYPYLSSADNWSSAPNTISQFIPLATLTSGFTSFGTSSGSGYSRYYHSTVGALDIYHWNGATSDNGQNASGHWNPFRVVVFAGGVGGFTRIGDIPAEFCPGSTDGYSNANGSGNIIRPTIDQHAPRGSLVSQISLAASQTDPGRCHLVWSEGGDWGQCGITNGGNTAPLVWDGGPQNKGYRVNYTTWGPGGKLSDTDIFASNYDRTNAYFLSNEGNSSFSPFPVGYTWPQQSQFAGIVNHKLRNDNAAGTPYLFAAIPQIFQNPHGVGPDTHGNPWLDYTPVFADTLHVYDLSGGAVQVQMLNLVALGPTNDEINRVWTVGPPWANPVGPVDSVWDNFTESTQVNLVVIPWPNIGISLPYDDPDLGVPVYLVHLPLVKRFTPQAVGGVAIGEFTMRAFYRVPCDMSADFDFLDGERLIHYTVNKEPIQGFFPQNFFYGSDFFSDPKNIWVPAPYGSGDSFGTGGLGYLGAWFDRVCFNAWTGIGNEPPLVGPNVTDYYGGAQCPGFHYDAFANTITVCTATTPDGNPGTPGPLFAITTLNICRGCRSCPCGVGVHLDHRF